MNNTIMAVNPDFEVMAILEEKHSAKINFFHNLHRVVQAKVGNEEIVDVIFQEVCKEIRSERMQKEKEARTGVSFATPKQVGKLLSLKIPVPANLTKAEASVLISEALR